MVGVAAPESVTLGVLSPLQHKLLALVGAMLIAHPARRKHTHTHTHLGSYTCKEVVITCVHLELT